MSLRLTGHQRALIDLENKGTPSIEEPSNISRIRHQIDRAMQATDPEKQIAHAQIAEALIKLEWLETGHPAKYLPEEKS